MDTWLKWTNSINNGPLILLGLPAGVGAAGKPKYYFPPNQLDIAYKVLTDIIIDFLENSSIKIKCFFNSDTMRRIRTSFCCVLGKRFITSRR